MVIRYIYMSTIAPPGDAYPITPNPLGTPEDIGRSP